MNGVISMEFVDGIGNIDRIISERIGNVESELKSVLRKLETWEPGPEDFDDEFQESLRDNFGDTVSIAGYSYDLCYILRIIDPTAYRTYRNDYVDSLENERLQSYRYADLETEVDTATEHYHEIVADLADYTHYSDRVDELTAIIEKIEELAGPY